MATDPEAHKRAARGARSRELLDSDTFQGAVGDLNAELERSILTSRPHDTEARERQFLEYHALKRVVSRLHQWVEDGNLAQREIDSDNP